MERSGNLAKVMPGLIMLDCLSIKADNTFLLEIF